MAPRSTKPEKSPEPRKKAGNRGMGRPKGARNKATLEIEAKARLYCDDALAALHSICRQSESDSARVSAATALLDRGYGRPKQVLEFKKIDQSTPDEELDAIISGGR